MDFLDLYSILTYWDIIDMNNSELNEYFKSLLTSRNPSGFWIVVNDYYLEKIARRKKNLFWFNVDEYIK